MKIGTVLTATDTNPLYMEFIPLFINSWHTMFPEIDVIVVLIANEIPTELSAYATQIHLSPPIEGMNTAFQAQCIRLLYPRSIKRAEGVLISDMDMIPMNRTYYENPIKDYPDTVFISYRDLLLPHELPMCYNVALPSVWSSVFGTLSDVEQLRVWYSKVEYDGKHGGKGWGTDQHILINSFNAWPGPKVILNDRDTSYKRLCRNQRYVFNNTSLLANMIRIGAYSDYHCLRPHSKYRTINEWILEQLRHQRASTT